MFLFTIFSLILSLLKWLIIVFICAQVIFLLGMGILAALSFFGILKDNRELYNTVYELSLLAVIVDIPLGAIAGLLIVFGI